MTLDFDSLVALLARDGGTVPFSGILEELTEDGTVRRWAVQRDGHLVRVEEPPGTLSLIAGHRTYWRSWPVDPGVVALPRYPGDENLDFGVLTMGEDPEAYWLEWLGQDRDRVVSTLTRTTYEGRPAWRFEAPFVKGGTPTLTVDDELGIVVWSERPDVGVFQSWTELRADRPLSPEVFRHDGPWLRAEQYDYPDGWVPE